MNAGCIARSSQSLAIKLPATAHLAQHKGPATALVPALDLHGDLGRLPGRDVGPHYTRSPTVNSNA